MGESTKNKKSGFVLFYTPEELYLTMHTFYFSRFTTSLSHLSLTDTDFTLVGYG